MNRAYHLIWMTTDEIWRIAIYITRSPNLFITTTTITTTTTTTSRYTDSYGKVRKMQFWFSYGPFTLSNIAPLIMRISLPNKRWQLKNRSFHTSPCSKLAPLSQGVDGKCIALNVQNFWPALCIWKSWIFTKGGKFLNNKLWAIMGKYWKWKK